MKKKITELFKKKFIKNVLLVASGTAMAQVIIFALLPIITRLYGPDAYGIMGTFVAAINIFIPIAALTLPIAIVLPKDDAEAFSIIKTSLKLILTISTSLLIGILTLQDFIIDLFNIKDLGNYLLLIPIAVLLAGLSQVMRQWLIRNNTFKVIASATVYQALFSHGGMVLVGLAYPVATVLIIFTVFKHGLAAIIMYFKTKNYMNIYSGIRDSTSTFKTVLGNHKDFPKYRAPQVLLNGASTSFPVLILTTFFGPAAAGFYTLGKTSLAVPIQLLGKSVGEVFYPRFAKAYNDKQKLSPMLLKSTGGLFILGSLPFGLIILFGPEVFTLVFGSDWSMAGEYARWIALWQWFMLSNRPSVHSIPVLSAQKFHFYFSIIATPMRILSLFLGYYLTSSDVVTVALFCITSVLVNIVLVIVTLYKARNIDALNYQGSAIL